MLTQPSSNLQPSREPRDVVLRARNVRFDWAELPLHYFAGEPFSTHWVNVLHLLLPTGEHWFAKVLSEALPLIQDEKLRADVTGFIGQEVMHAAAHESARARLRVQGLDVDAYVAELEWFFQERLGDRGLTGQAAEEWLVERLALIASIEHVTAVLGHWILNAPALDNVAIDPTMLDLLRWHGAEEVEHRSVAFDLYQHIDGRYRRRIRSHIIMLPLLIWLWARGMRVLMASDPLLRAQPGRKAEPRWIDWWRAGRRGILPSTGALLRSYWSYFRRDFHPAQECSTSQAVSYLASSPSVTQAL